MKEKQIKHPGLRGKNHIVRVDFEEQFNEVKADMIAAGYRDPYQAKYEHSLGLSKYLGAYSDIESNLPAPTINSFFSDNQLGGVNRLYHSFSSWKDKFNLEMWARCEEDSELVKKGEEYRVKNVDRDCIRVTVAGKRHIEFPRNKFTITWPLNYGSKVGKEDKETIKVKCKMPYGELLTMNKEYEASDCETDSERYFVFDNSGDWNPYLKERFEVSRLFETAVIVKCIQESFINGLTLNKDYQAIRWTDSGFQITKDDLGREFYWHPKHLFQIVKTKEEKEYVQCIDKSGSLYIGELTLDKVYELQEKPLDDSNSCYSIINDKGRKFGYYKYRFKKVKNMKQVKCIDDSVGSLILNKVYYVKDDPTNDEQYLLVDDSGRHLGYFKSRFVDVPQKKIIGYKSPFDMFSGLIKAGHRYIGKSGGGYVPYGATITKYDLPAEIVEKWEPIYEPEKPSSKEFTLSGYRFKVSNGYLETYGCKNWEVVPTVTMQLLREIAKNSQIEVMQISGRTFDYNDIIFGLKMYDEFQEQFVAKEAQEGDD